MSNVIDLPKKKEPHELNIVIHMDAEQNIEGIQAPAGMQKSNIMGLMLMAILMVADEYQ